MGRHRRLDAVKDLSLHFYRGGKLVESVHIRATIERGYQIQGTVLEFVKRDITVVVQKYGDKP